MYTSRMLDLLHVVVRDFSMFSLMFFVRYYFLIFVLFGSNLSVILSVILLIFHSFSFFFLICEETVFYLLYLHLNICDCQRPFLYIFLAWQMLKSIHFSRLSIGLIKEILHIKTIPVHSWLI